MRQPQAVITHPRERVRESWQDPARGDVSWFTLFSGDITPTTAMSAGVAEINPGGSLEPHRHAEPEIYFVVEGSGILTVNGEETPVGAGTAIYIPGDAQHGLRNDTGAQLRLFYVFPIDCFSDVIYRFPTDKPSFS